MIIVGVTGSIGHGKTTLAEYLAVAAPTHRHFETSDLINEVANDLRSANKSSPSSGDLIAINDWLLPLQAILTKRVNVTLTSADLVLTPDRLAASPENYQKLFEYLDAMQAEPELQHTIIDAANKGSFRSLQQWLGGYLAGLHDGIWYEEILQRVQALSATELITIGGVRYPSDARIIRESGGSIVAVMRSELSDRDTTDLTERHRSQIIPDSVVYNDATLNQLATCARALYDDLRSHTLQREYRATTYETTPASPMPEPS
jgi:hypothetical protein